MAELITKADPLPIWNARNVRVNPYSISLSAGLSFLGVLWHFPAISAFKSFERGEHLKLAENVEKN